MNDHLPTLDNFISHAQKCAIGMNSYVREPGFQNLYVRYLKRRYIHTHAAYAENVLDLANMNATTPGSGAFTTLVERLRKDYPEMSLYVENVLNPRFGEKLLRMGFKPVTEQHPFSYFMVST